MRIFSCRVIYYYNSFWISRTDIQFYLSHKVSSKAKIQFHASNAQITSHSYTRVTLSINPKNDVLGFAKEQYKSASITTEGREKCYHYMIRNPSNAFRGIKKHFFSLCEIIALDKHLKLFFDIDGTIPPYFCEAVENILLNYDGKIIKCVPPRIILSSCKGEKLSFHIIYPTVLFSSGELEKLREYCFISLEE